MAEKQIAIAKETSVQEVSGKIGNKNAGGNRTGATIFARVKYILGVLSTLGGLFTAARAEKITSIGSDSDSEDAATVFGRLKGIKTAAENAVSDPVSLTAAVTGNENTITILDEELYISRDSSLKVGTFVPEIGGVYKITVTVKNTSLLAGSVYIQASDFDSIPIYSSTNFINIASIDEDEYHDISATAFFRAGVPYDFYIKGGGLLSSTALYINSIILQYNTEKKLITANTTLASANNATQLTLSATRGQQTSYTEICTYTAVKDGSVRLTFSIPTNSEAYTRFAVKKHLRTVHAHLKADAPTVFDIDMKSGESFDVGAYSSDGEQYWRINSVTVSYDEVLLGVNPMYVRVWEEAVE